METRYRIKGHSKYFKEKYGTHNPVIEIEGNWKEMTGGSWGMAHGNPAAIIFGIRSGFDSIPSDDEGVLYGKISSMGELVHKSELESI